MTTTANPTVFYSWQSDLPGAATRSLIGDALDEALHAIASDASITHAPRRDQDTQGVTGSPDIGATILAKIDVATIFVADVSLAMHDPVTGKKAPNANVLFELGYAWKALGAARVVLIMNEHFGGPLELPFDLRTKRVITFQNDPDISERAAARRELASKVKAQIRGILDVTSNAPPDAGTIHGGNNAAGIIAKDSLAKLALPIRGMTIDPLPQRPPALDELAFSRDARSLALDERLAERAGFPSLAPYPKRAPYGLLWDQTPLLERPSDQVLALGFDGSFFFASTLWESQRTGLSWGANGLDVGSCIDVAIASIAMAARVRAKIGITRSARATFHLKGIRDRHVVLGGPPYKERFYGPNLPRADQDDFDFPIEVAADFVADRVRESVIAMCKKLEYVLGAAFDNEYVRSRIDLALSQL